MWNIPNSLTAFRIVLVPILVAVLLTEFPDREYWGLGIFVVATVTDYFDGFIARRTGAVTVMGSLLDPIADKLLITAAFISLVELDLAPAWMVTIIVGREFAVTALRLIALERGLPIAANRWGKAKMVSQVIAVAILILGKKLGSWIVLGHVSLWAALALTVVSMVVYFWQNRSLLAGDQA